MPPRLRASLPCLTAAALLALSLAPAPAAAEPTATWDTPLALTPPMGWNNWAHYMCDIDEATVVANADALVSSGLAAKGYDTVTVDDCWMRKERDARGDLVTDTDKFPHGMAWLGEYLHAKGLKFGIYEDSKLPHLRTLPRQRRARGRRRGPLRPRRAAVRFLARGLREDGRLQPVGAARQDEGAGLPGRLQLRRPRAARERAAHGAVRLGARLLPAGRVGRRRLAQGARLGRRDRPAVARGARHQGLQGGRPRHLPVELGPRQLRVQPVARPLRGPRQLERPRLPDRGRPRADGRGEPQPGRALGDDGGPLHPVVPGVAAEPGRPRGPRQHPPDRPRPGPVGRQGAVVSSNATFEVLVRPLAGGDRAVAVLNRSGSARDVSVPLADIGLHACTADAEDLWSGRTTEVSDALTGRLAAHDTAVWRLTPHGCAEAVPTGQINGLGARCADGANTTGVGAVVLAACTAGADQRWTLGGGGRLRLAGECLTAGAGGAVELADCAPGRQAGQSWRHRRDGALVEETGGQCLTAPAAPATPDAPTERLRLAPCGDHQADQVWSLPV